MGVTIDDFDNNSIKEGLNDLMGGGVNQAPNGNNDMDVIGFSGKELITLSTNKGSEYVLELAEIIKNTYHRLPEATKPKVSVVDKNGRPLEYSSVVVHYKSGNVVYYYIVTLEATGELPKTAESIANIVEVSIKSTNQIPYIFVTADAIDATLHDEVIAALKLEYTDTKTVFNSVDGLVVPSSHDNNETVSTNIAAISFNAVYSNAMLSEGKIQDMNIRKARAKSPNTILRFDSNLFKQVVQNEVDNPIRADWQIELCAVTTQTNIQSPNIRDGKHTINKVCGFTDSIPEEIVVQTAPNMPPVTQTRLHPHHIITSASLNSPTPSSMLLSLATALVMTNDTMWPGALLPEDAKKPLHNTGALNIITNLEGNQNGIGEVLDFSKNKLSVDEAYQLIKNMYTLGSVISFDVEVAGPQSFYTSMLAVAAEPTMSDAKIAASEDIINAAHWLTDGLFPADFDVNQIFAHEGIVVPLGKWSDKTGERDIRDIDVSFVATNTNDTTLIAQWALSNLPEAASGKDPYLTKVEIISKLVPSAIISGKAIRVTFTDTFIKTFINAVTAAGLDAIFKPAITYAANNNLSIVSNFMGAASIDNVSVNYARQQMVSGPTYSTPYNYTGYGRY